MIARTTVLTLASALALGSLSVPADAQIRQRVVEVFGADKCPEGSREEIIVCAPKPESDRFRLPTTLREAAVAAADRESQESRVDEMVALGRSGPGSCGVQGPGAFTGCFQRLVEGNKAERNALKRAR